MTSHKRAMKSRTSLRQIRKDEEDQNCCYMCKAYTIKANILYYVDNVFDVLFSLVADRPEDFVNLLLFLISYFIRVFFWLILHSYNFIRAKACCCSNYRYEEGSVSLVYSMQFCEDVRAQRKKLKERDNCLGTFLLRMANFGLKARKLGDNEHRLSFDAKRLLCVDFKLQAYDSVRNYTNLAMISAVG